MRRRVIAGLLVAGAVVVAAQWAPLARLFSAPVPVASAPSRPAEAAPENVRNDQRFAALPTRTPLGESRGALFASPPPPPAPKPAPVPVAAPEPKPVPPPMPYRVAGRIIHDGVSKVVLAKGDRVLTVQQGDRLEGGYHVDAITAEEVALIYEPLGVRERLSMASAASIAVPATAPAAAGGSIRSAQLRWDGPESVQAGDMFNLTLKVSSNEPLRAAPFQLTYDPRLLQAVAVRPGKFLGDASFNYRINPSGAIFVGASGAAGPASDAELVVVTFKPIRPAVAAEVKLNSLQLQGMVGTPISVEPLAAFRTAVAP